MSSARRPTSFSAPPATSPTPVIGPLPSPGASNRPFRLTSSPSPPPSHSDDTFQTLRAPPNETGPVLTRVPGPSAAYRSAAAAGAAAAFADEAGAGGAHVGAAGHAEGGVDGG